MSAPVYVALVHHPVRARDGSVITTAVTNVDVHDIARSARTFGLAGYFVVTPVTAQRAIVARILEHWHEGEGKTRIPERGEALSRVVAVPLVGDAIAEITAREGTRPIVVATTAQAGAHAVRFANLRSRMASERVPFLVLLGTGHGLAESALALADLTLESIVGVDGYNHLSVRAAAAILFDRLLGAPREP